jgi:hypothetical protein
MKVTLAPSRFQGEDNPGWADTDVSPLKTIPASAFEAITPPPLEK